MEAPRAILVDIEGTTSSISFVHDVLFPYARAALPAFVRDRQNDPEVAAELRAAAAAADLAEDDLDGITAALLAWIDADRKETSLKALQGMVWEAGYAEGAFRAHMYADATEALRAWHGAGLPLYVYSSGSVHAQRLFFGHSEAGDLLPLFSGHFDTTSGNKREAEAYARIAAAIDLPAADVLFLSDVPEELDAAGAAGMQTVWVIREEEGRYRMADAASRAHAAVARLTDLQLAPRTR
ncbi:MAG TPA: acireductone synthase [Pseudomonadales bacterium]|nr:acireductone synthase [Pseudomonadales bacterium]